MPNKIIENLSRRMAESISGVKPTVAEQIVTRQARLIQVNTSELRECIKANPEHPVAKAYTMGIQGFPDTEPVAVESLDLEALISNQEVISEEVVENGQKIVKKSLRKEEKPAAEIPTPSSSPTPEPLAEPAPEVVATSEQPARNEAFNRRR